MKHLFFTFFLLNAIAISYTNSKAAVVADFSSNVVSGCKPLTVIFQDQSTGSPTAWAWNFGNGNTSTLQNPSAVYNNPGTYTVTLTASNATSTNTITKSIVVFNNPTAGFTTTPSTSCAGNSITFNDNSTIGSSAINSWHWDYGDGNALNTSSGTSSHTYISAGTYPASLIVTDVNGCTGNVVTNVSVIAAPDAAFTGTPTSACSAPLTVAFSNSSTSTGAVTYLWNFGDGGTSTAISPSHTYNSTGAFTVKLYINQGSCIDSIVKPNYIVVNNIAANFSANDTNVCVGQTLNFTNASVPISTTHSWTFGDGGTSTILNPTHVYSVAGTYTVTLIESNGTCSGTKTKTSYITVNNNPVAGFTTTTTNSCLIPFDVAFTDTTAGATTWTWNFGNGNTGNTQTDTNTYISAGTYNVTLTAGDANGCTNTITKNNLVVIIPPAANFNSNIVNGCAPLTVNFTDASISGSIPIATYIWDFGDGNIDTTSSPNISNTYLTQGIYDVKLIIITSTGCTDSIVKIGYIQVGVPPATNFVWDRDTICFGESVQFTDSTDIATSWLWNFGLGGTDTQQDPLHLFTDTGTFDIQLIAYFNGCPDTLIIPKSITVNGPKPAFTFQLNCINYYSVSFTNTSVIADSVVWDFGDGTIDSSNINAPTHIYSTRGSKTVKITAYNYTTGCSFFASQSFTIAEPIANFGNAPLIPYGCVPLNIAFSDSSQDANIHNWLYGTGATSAANSPSYTYNNIGLYTVSLIVTDINNCTDTMTKTNYIHALGITSTNFSALPLTGCTPLSVNFTDATVSDSSIVQWSWNFGDGSPAISAGASPNHLYTVRGNYNVSLTVTDTNGCTKNIVKNNYIVPTKPYPALAVDTFRCKNDVLTFNASATTVSNPATYIWNFGDGTIDTTTTSTNTHFYNSDNLYNVTLTVIDLNGCDSSASTQIRILKPVALFTDSILTYGCGTEQILFTDQSTGYVNQWNWSFGNGATSTLQNPTYTYTSPGVYLISLIVQNIGGCRDTTIQDSLVIVPGPIGSYSFDPSSGCTPLTVNFISTTTSASYFTWDFGDGTVLTQVTQSAPTHVYLNAVNVTPTLLMGDTLPNGQLCELPATNLTGNIVATEAIHIDISPTGPLNITEDSYLNLTTEISGIASTNLTYSWTPSTGLSCITCPAPGVANTGESLYYYVTVLDVGSGGCSDKDSIKIEFISCELNAIIPNIFTPNDDGVNDLLTVSGLCIRNEYELVIYNRWGNEIYKTNLRNNGWDGRSTSGEIAPDGIYYYLIKVDDKSYKGYVRLAR